MLLENHETLILDFKINKDLTLRRLMNEQEFKQLVLTAVRLYEEQDPTVCVCLLDKVKETKHCLELMISLQLEHL